ncbi:MAG: L,D-peptidoglycan transpeptidase YkuD (ErfK/YbiS/YcfS/YnhG family), partial [Flavobacteriales bacterium]
NDKPWLGKLHLLRDWTYGCIAVTNKQMEELYRVINVGTRIVIRP